MRIFWSAPTRAKRISGSVEGQLELRGGHPPQLLAGDDGRAVALDQADLPGDGEGRVRVVAGDHDDLDARLLAVGDGLRAPPAGAGLPARPGPTGSGPPPGGHGRTLGHGPVGDRQHPQPFAAMASCASKEFLVQLRVQRTRLPSPICTRRA